MSKNTNLAVKNAGFGTAPVFFTAISTILGAILFLRFGYAVGNVGFWGTVAIVVIGHMVTIPTAMAIAEIATNQKVEGGGEYYIISRSFGLNIGAAIGVALFMSQAISVAFYVIAFAEAFEPVLKYVEYEYGYLIDKRLISVPAMTLLAILILTKGADLGVKALYIVVVVLFISLGMFFLGSTDFAETFDGNILNNKIPNGDNFFYVFAICFPAFTGMTAGVGLSGDLRDPSKSIPYGTLAATLSGMVIYIIIAYKMASSASAEDLATNQFVMGDIALWYPIIPIGLACATISSALGSIMVAPRTLQALGNDKVLPLVRFGKFISVGKGAKNEPFNASIVTIIIAYLFIALGDVNIVAEIISMFFMVTYGSLCLISFLQHFAADPSYRPTFRSKWYISLFGFVMCGVLMFQMNTQYAVIAILIMVVLYLIIATYNKEGGGLASIFQGVVFQISHQLHVFLQKADKDEAGWRPSVVCISSNSFDRFQAFDLLRWISSRYGFGTYIHLIKGYFSRATHNEAKEALVRLLTIAEQSNVYVDTMISPSYTSAIAQVIQLPGISGNDNNMILFEFSKQDPKDLQEIVDNYKLTRAGLFDVCILGSCERNFGHRRNIHIWMGTKDYDSANLMILMAYILLGHKDWSEAEIKIFAVYPADEKENQLENIRTLVNAGRLPISVNNIQVLEQQADKDIKTMINERSRDASLTVLGFRGEAVKKIGNEVFKGYDGIGNVLFVNAHKKKVIK